MNRKKTFLKIILAITIIFLIFNNVFTSEVNATENFGSIPGLGDLDEYKAGGGSSASFNDIVKNIVGIIRIVGSIISVVVLVALGIKYMIGSIEERAEYKETMRPYLIGAILLFGISNVTDLLYRIGANLF